MTDIKKLGGFGLVTILVLTILITIPTPASCQEPIEPESVIQGRNTLVCKTNIYENLPKEGEGIRLGIYQGETAVGTEQAVQENLDRLEEIAELASHYDVQLLSFPELYLSGYALDPKLAKELAQEKDGPAVRRVQEVAKKYNMAIIFPYPEVVHESDGAKYYDAIALIGPDGTLLEDYQKTHLYGDAERLNWSFGWSDYPVIMVEGFPVGILNCYEAEFPELSRILALRGAKLVVIPTAADNYYTLPSGERSKVPYPDISELLIPANAYQNNIFCAYSNRRGHEHVGKNQWHYRGNSIICGPHGDVIVAADHEQETLLMADIVPQYYGPTHPAEDHTYLKDRRPELYGELVKEEVEFGGGYTYPDHQK